MASPLLIAVENLLSVSNGYLAVVLLIFLPSGKEYQPLCKLVEFILREQMAYDLELAMDEREAPLFCLDTRQNIALGWTSFLGQDAANKHVLIQVRQ